MGLQVQIDKKKINQFLWDTFSDEYYPLFELNTEGLDPTKGIDVCIPCGVNHHVFVIRAISSALDLNFVNKIIVNLQLEENQLIPNYITRFVYNYQNKIKLLPTKVLSPSKSRNLCREHAESDYILYLDADDELHPIGVRTMYEELLDSPKCLIAPNETVVDTWADVMFGVQSSMIAPKTLEWVEDLQVYEDCATYLGYPIKPIITDKPSIIRNIIPNGQSQVDKDTSIFTYLNWLEDTQLLPFDIKDYMNNNSCSELGSYFFMARATNQ